MSELCCFAVTKRRERKLRENNETRDGTKNGNSHSKIESEISVEIEERECMMIDRQKQDQFISVTFKERHLDNYCTPASSEVQLRLYAGK